MRSSAVIAAALAIVGVVSANPVGHNPETRELQSRATQSSIGWYSYGCYMDCYDGMNRYLPHFAYRDADDNTPDKCIAACKGAGFDYAGLQFGQECWCGPKLAGPPTKPSECDFKCTDGHNKCGGGCRNNIWSAHRKSGH